MHVVAAPNNRKQVYQKEGLVSFEHVDGSQEKDRNPAKIIYHNQIDRSTSYLAGESPRTIVLAVPWANRADRVPD